MSELLSKREREELQGDLKQLKEGLEGVLGALWKQQHLGFENQVRLKAQL